MPSAEYAARAARAAKYGTGIVGLWKRGWNEVPEIMASTPCFILGAIIMGYIGIKDHFSENRTKRFKELYTIYRPDDKRLKLLQRHIHDNSPLPTSTPPGFVTTKQASCNSEFKF